MKYKCVVFDMDGVLRIGSHPIKHANETIQHIRKKGIRGMLSTNECRYTDAELREDLEELGINFPDEWTIYTSGMAVRDYLEKKVLKKTEKQFSVGIIGEMGLFETINELSHYSNFELVDTPPKYETKLILIIGTVNKMKISNLEKGLKWLKAGAKIITTCEDASDPSSKGDFNLGMPNHTLHLLKYNITSTKTYSLGKPHPIHAKKIKETFKDINSNEILFVGDTIYTDIQLAEENDISSCLVLTGNSNKETKKQYIMEPDITIESVKELIDYF